jgi:hypothetical protein
MVREIGALNYNKEELEYIEEKWGTSSIGHIAKTLKRPIGGIINIKQRLGLGAFLENGEYISVNQLFKAIGRPGGSNYLLKHWLKKGFPVKMKKVHTCSFKIILIKEFWKWAEQYRMHINFYKFKEKALGEEPSWVKDQRKADIEFAKYKVTPWTGREDNQLKNLLKTYRYTYPELSKTILRTEGAIKRRVVDLGIIERPLREDPHGIWTDLQVNTVIEMYEKGYKSTVIKEYIAKSEQAINGKIERLIKEGLLTKWK